MKVSYDILKKFVTPPRELSGKELSETLTMSTVEVEGYADRAVELDHMVVGVVTGVRAHPKADKLKLATVDVGSAEAIEVVCGGVNLAEGMKVAFAKPGARVKWHGEGDWITLMVATIRGVESKGMICAAEELGVADPEPVEGGVMDLSHLKSAPGTPLADALGECDIILDIDNKSLTHRPDLWGHLGLARELSALWQVPLNEPEVPRLKPEIDVPLMVSVKAPAKILRYMVVAMEGVKPAESPAWLKQALTNLGMRPINVIVDVTNYVMLELGQPLHAFDLDKLASPEIVIRQAKPGEKFTTLDGVERTLDASMLLIADTKHAQAIAGVMGGSTSEVSEATTSIVLESATFEAVNVRTTASRLGLRTEASARFEKALDPQLPELALKRAVQLLIELCPGAKVSSPVVDVFDNPPAAKPITLSLPWLYKRLGVVIPEAEVVGILERLGFAVKPKVDELHVTPPSFRATRDITIPEDLVEEVARIYGYGKIPLSLPAGKPKPPLEDAEQVVRWQVRDVLTAHGFTETLSYSFVGPRVLSELSPALYSALGLSVEPLLTLVNPVNQAEPAMRSALIPNIVGQAVLNALHLPHQPIQLFELGRVFRPEAGTWAAGTSQAMLPAQPWHLGLAVRLPGNGWAETYQQLRGALELVAHTLGFAITFEPAGHNMAKVNVAGKHVGGIAVTQFMKSSLKPVVALAELNLEMVT